MEKKNSNNYFIFFYVFFISLFVGIFFLFSGIRDENIDFLLSVNGEKIEKNKFITHLNQVKRDFSEENLSSKDLKKKAIEKTIRRTLLGQYFKEEGIRLSLEDIERMFSSFVLKEKRAETKEDFFEIMEIKGFSRGEVETEVLFRAKEEKLIGHLMRNIEVEKSEIEKRYNKLKKEADNEENIDILPLYEIEEKLKKKIRREKAKDKIINDLDKKREEAEIIFL